MPEMMVTLFIFTMIAAAIFFLFIAGQRYWYVAMDNTYLQQQARLAMDKMIEELYKSKPGEDNGNIIVSVGGLCGQLPQPGVGSAIRFRIPTLITYQAYTGDNMTSYYIPDALTKECKINWGAGTLGQSTYNIKYHIPDAPSTECCEDGICSHQLVRDVESGSTLIERRVIANNIKEVKFTGKQGSGLFWVFANQQPDKVIIEITASKTTIFKHELSYKLTAELVFRN